MTVVAERRDNSTAIHQGNTTRQVRDPALAQERRQRRDENPVGPVAHRSAIPGKTRHPDAPPAPEDYRSAMGQVPAAVTVVTTASNGGRQGLTVTAASSVSADPPQLLVCINRETRSAAAISAAGHFGVNYLDSAHCELAAVFAAPTDDHEERFRLARWVDSPNGTPLLQDALISFDCTVVNEIHSGTHTIFIGQINGLRARDGEPLLYQRGAFTTTDPSPGHG